MRRLAGIEIGAVVDANTVDEVAARLRTAKRFDDVRVLKRFASIEDPSQILLVIIVDEGPVHIERTGDEVNPTRVVRSHPLGLMVMPVLTREDGYGFTYGARLARRTVAGRNSRLSFPLTWGGEKKAGADFEKTIEHAPVDRVIAGVAVSQRTNPFYEQDDDRQRAWVRVERELVPALRVGATAGWQHVSFMDLDDRFAQAGADVVLDTRVDPNLPRNAVFARASWEHLGGSGSSRTLRTRCERLSRTVPARTYSRYARYAMRQIVPFRRTCNRCSAAWRTCADSGPARWPAISSSPIPLSSSFRSRRRSASARSA